MGSIAFGNTILTYRIRLSPKAQKKRIEITPFGVEIIAPEETPEAEIAAFMQEKAKDVFVAQERLKQKNASLFREDDQFFAGGKVSFRGRRLMVSVEYAEVEKPSLSFKSRFCLTLPEALRGRDNAETIRALIEKWLDARLYEDSREIAESLGAPRGLRFKRVRVREQKNVWATCGHDGILYINRLLAKAPKKALEYVVAHELAHLAHRNHSAAFWSLVGEMFPEYQAYQDMLDRL
ncbi:MAG TPA: DUF45 domain-containing protein [Treponemataceae bacterium]|nr:DUF45 domain-containing protein [Treponemataceae bacterium]HPS44026.1 DUF45 domain-containing protein [Treponemataceae bacterium]